MGSRSRKQKTLFTGLIGFAVLCLVIIGIFALVRKNPNTLPATITGAETSFTIYYFQDNQPPSGLELKENSASLSNNTILVFSLENDRGDVVAITEQKLPDELKNSTLQGDESFETAYGKATLSMLPEGRTSGSLATKEGTLILANTNSPIEITTFKDILRSLKPL